MMKSRLIGSARRAGHALFPVLVMLSMVAPLWAQNEPEKPEGSWVMSYLMVTVLLGLGLFIVCRGAKRFYK